MLVEIVGKRYEEKLLTTSRKIAESFEKEHKEVIRAIEGQLDADGKTKHSGLLSQLEQGGDIPVDNYFIKSSYVASNGRKYTEYLITRDGFSLLVMGFTGEKALRWKIKYIDAFNKMESELKRILTERQQWQIERDKGVVIRHILTDTIKMKVSESPHKKFSYSNYTNLIYRSLFGKTAKELESQYEVKAKETLRDFFTAADLEKVQELEMLVSSLINCGWGYQQIKEFIQTQTQNMLEQAG